MPKILNSTSKVINHKYSIEYQILVLVLHVIKFEKKNTVHILISDTPCH